MARILDAMVLAQLQDEAPKVTVPSYEAHQALVKALTMWSSAHPTNGTDANGRSYWIAALHDLQPLIAIPTETPKQVGNACRNFCLVMKRENDGFRVAWSQKQLDILRKAFGLGEQK
jgi:hypothetical protein